MQQWEGALDDLTKLKEIIDGNSFAPILQQLQQRVWLMHWALFVFFEHENGRNAIIDLFFQDRCCCPMRSSAWRALLPRTCWPLFAVCCIPAMLFHVPRGLTWSTLRDQRAAGLTACVHDVPRGHGL